MILRFKEKDKKGVGTTRIVSVLCGFNKNSLDEMIPLLEEYRSKGSFVIVIKDNSSFREIEKKFNYLGIKFSIESYF